MKLVLYLQLFQMNFFLIWTHYTKLFFKKVSDDEVFTSKLIRLELLFCIATGL